MKYFITSILVLALLAAGAIGRTYVVSAKTETQKNLPVVVRSIDTMKYSRDLSREKLKDASFDEEIQHEMQLIKETGATHVAIDTPYDEEFVPILARWIAAARAQGLSIWLRGNFSGWEGWFGYKKIDRAEHMRLLKEFLSRHMDLFKDGDVFTPCPECENGGPGDPRKTKDAAGYDDFLVQEHKIATDAFHSHSVAVAVYESMNFDIAWQILTPDTVKSLGGMILIDHYVSSPQKFSDDIDRLRQKLQGDVGLGEFGAPIPDLNGTMGERAQADFVKSLTDILIKKNVAVSNYWTLKGGSTSIVKGDGTLKSVSAVLKEYYKTPYVYGVVMDDLHRPIPGAQIIANGKTVKTVSDDTGAYQLTVKDEPVEITVKKDGYLPTTEVIQAADASDPIFQQNVFITPEEASWFYKVKRFFLQLFTRKQ